LGKLSFFLTEARSFSTQCYREKETSMVRLLILSEVIDEITSCLEISPDEFAAILGIQPRTVGRWRKDESFPQSGSRIRLDEFTALARRLGESFDSQESAQRWLRTESDYFGGLTPMDALLRGRIDRVDSALEALDSGIFL
jgi:uncharacterized protein (DUF2384 family)